MSVRLRRTAVVLAAGAALAAAPLAASAATAAPLAPVLEATSPTAIADHYIVVLEQGSTAATAASVAKSAQVTTSATFGTVFAGFSATLDAAALAAVRANPAVDYISADQTVSLTTTQDRTTQNRSTQDRTTQNRTTQDRTTQDPATWGLARIDQRNTPVGTSYAYTSSGTGVRVYMIDTGIRSSHTDFTGRIVGGVNFVGSEPAGKFQDCNGHGTHTSGTAGGTKYGVAKGVEITPVRVIGCGNYGSTTDIVQGMDWVAANAVHPSVASMSIGSGINTALDDAAAGVVAAGVAFTISAGNSLSDACNFSPAREPSVITVAAMNSSDGQAYFSNYGSCIDIYAPGLDITSDWNNSDTATQTISGTSMAAPHVAGTLARYLSNVPTATVTQLSNVLVNQSTKNTLTGLGARSPNRMLYANPIY